MLRIIHATLFCAVIVVIGLMVPWPAGAANIVSNPGFETGSFAPWVRNPSADLPWLVVGSGSGILPHSGSFFAQTGCIPVVCITPDPATNGNWLYQDLPTVSGTRYNLSFFYASNSPGPAELQVLWGGSVVLSDTTVGSTAYVPITVSNLLATSSTTRLEFLGEQVPTFNGLDDVDVEGARGVSVPEPNPLALLGLGLVGLLSARKRVPI